MTEVQGPSFQKFINQSRYSPVDCDFTDRLEELSTVRIPIDVSYYTADGELKHCRGEITDMRAQEGADFLIMSSGEEVRLDRVRSIRPDRAKSNF